MGWAGSVESVFIHGKLEAIASQLPYWCLGSEPFKPQQRRLHRYITRKKMAFFTKAEARSAAKRAMRNRSLDEMIAESMESSKRATRFDIFLSHSINDAELVLGAKVFLEEMGKKFMSTGSMILSSTVVKSPKIPQSG